MTPLIVPPPSASSTFKETRLASGACARPVAARVVPITRDDPRDVGAVSLVIVRLV